MGANRRIMLAENMCAMAFEQILRDAKIQFTRWNESWWNNTWMGWKTGQDIELFNGKTIEFHYAYWSEEHSKLADHECELIIGLLEKSVKITKKGDWRY